MTGKMKYPKFPETTDYSKYLDWQREVKEIIEKRIKKDSKKMGGDLTYYFDIRPLLEALK